METLLERLQQRRRRTDLVVELRAADEDETGWGQGAALSRLTPEQVLRGGDTGGRGRPRPWRWRPPLATARCETPYVVQGLAWQQ